MKTAIPDRGSLAKEYLERYEQHQEIVDWLRRDLDDLLNREGVRAIVRARIKSFESYYQKS
jgi:aminoglycoside phosphotransferase family enzyme